MRFRSKIANFAHTCVFCVHAEGVPLQFGIGAWVENKRERWCYRAKKKKCGDIFSCVDTIPQCDGQRTDRHWTTAKQNMKLQYCWITAYQNISWSAVQHCICVQNLYQTKPSNSDVYAHEL